MEKFNSLGIIILFSLIIFTVIIYYLYKKFINPKENIPQQTDFPENNVEVKIIEIKNDILRKRISNGILTSTIIFFILIVAAYKDPGSAAGYFLFPIAVILYIFVLPFYLLAISLKYIRTKKLFLSEKIMFFIIVFIIISIFVESFLD